MKRFLSAILAVAAVTTCYGQDKWLNIYKNVDGTHRVVANPVANISDIKHNGEQVDENAFTTLTLIVDGEEITVNLSEIEKCAIGHNIPTLNIVTDEYVSEIPSKEYYLTGNITLDGYGNYSDVAETAVSIKGRGNSTWGYAKKPYRLKFDKKISLCGLTKAKNYVLLANYIDPTLMRNAIALKIAQLLDLPYTNHAIPVNVTLNGAYRGSYMLTEKIGFNAASVNVKDETKAILFELDTNYDEPYKFKSAINELPVMVKDPDFDELVEADETLTAEGLLEKWQDDFNAMEASFEDGTFDKYFDMNQAVDYLMVYLVVYNGEVGHPKSVYIYKEDEESKYKLGPVWDFDWAYSFNSQEKEGLTPTWPLIGTRSKPGGKFFRKVVETEAFQTIFAERWEYFKTDVWPQVKEYMAEYHDLIEVSALQNGEVWQESSLPSYVAGSENFEQYYQHTLNFLEERIEWIDKDKNHGLY